MNYNMFIAALCLWRECRSESAHVMSAVYHVLLNRASDQKKRWPRTVHQVVLQRRQFSSFNKDDPNSIKFPQDDGGPDWKAWLQAQEVVQDSLGGDPTHGANHFVESNLPTFPEWADPNKETAEIGPFTFYKL